MNLSKLRAGLAASAVLLVAASANAQIETIVGLTAANEIFTFQSNTPSVNTALLAITGLSAGENVLGIDFRPATSPPGVNPPTPTLYGLTEVGGAYRAITINVATGAVTSAVTIAPGLSGSRFGVDFNPIPDRLRVYSDTDQNYRINVANGVNTVDGPITNTALEIVGAAYTNNLNGSTANQLFTLDANGEGLYQMTGGPQFNGSTLIATLSFANLTGTANIGTELGFDISGTTSIAYVGGSVTGSSTLTGASSFYTLNTGNGQLTFQGEFATAVGTVRGIAAPVGVNVAPEPGSMALLATGVVALGGVAVRRRRRNAE